MMSNNNTLDNQINPQRHAMNNNEELQQPFPSSNTVDLTPEELQSLVDEYERRIREYEDNMRAKQKHKVQSQRKVSDLHQGLLDEMNMMQEHCNVKGYVYGLVTESGKSLIGASDSLREWWKGQVKFDKTGLVQIGRYHRENSLYMNLNQENEAKSTFELLMEISDPILGSILSLLMQYCDPPQRKFPFEGVLQPPWWPTGQEGWWAQIGISTEGPPPFQKPHNLKKKWKVAVIVGILKVVSPKFSSLYTHVKQSRVTQRMNAKEQNFWSLALVSEAKQYCHEHPDSAYEAVAFQRTYGSS